MRPARSRPCRRTPAPTRLRRSSRSPARGGRSGGRSFPVVDTPCRSSEPRPDPPAAPAGITWPPSKETRRPGGSVRKLLTIAVCLAASTSLAGPPSAIVLENARVRVWKVNTAPAVFGHLAAVFVVLEDDATRKAGDAYWSQVPP